MFLFNIYMHSFSRRFYTERLTIEEFILIKTQSYLAESYKSRITLVGVS